MVAWLNTLTPDQADNMATQLKDFQRSWPSNKDDQTYAIQFFNDTLQECGIKPPPGIAVASGH
jgi:hypothetical protein